MDTALRVRIVRVTASAANAASSHKLVYLVDENDPVKMAMRRMMQCTVRVPRHAFGAMDIYAEGSS